MTRCSFGRQALYAAWCGCLTAAVLMLSACGGSDTSTASPAPVVTGAVTVHVTTSSGTPIADVNVGLGGRDYAQAARSDATGRVQFAGIRAGNANLSIYEPGFHSADHRFLVAPEVTTEVTLILEHVTEATPVVLNSGAVAASDGRSLTIDLDLALLDENGRAIATLTAADFEMIDSDCSFSACGYDLDYRRMKMDGYKVSADDAAFLWQVSSDRPTPPMTVGLLLEQSLDMVDLDPSGLRLPAVKAFLESILPPDTVSLATYHGTLDEVDLTTYGPFTSDGAQFADLVDAMAGQEGGSNPFFCAVADMQSWMSTEAPGGPDAPPATVVVVTSGGSNEWYGGGSSCAQLEAMQLGAVSMDGGPVVTLGGNVRGAAIAAATGGSFAVIHDPLQFEVALASLATIVGRTLDSNHLRFVLTPVGASTNGPVFRPGRQSIYANLYVRIGPHTRLRVPLVIPVQ